MAATQPQQGTKPGVPEPDSGMTSLSMLELAQVQDPRAWRRMVHIYEPLILSWGRRTGLSDEDAADVLQEVWRSVAANIDRFEKTAEKGSFRGWLWTITRNKLRDHFRSRQGKPTAAGGTDAHQRLQEVPDEEPSVDASVHADSPAQLLHRALESAQADFEPRTWKAFWRTTVDGIAPAEVAKELDLSVDSVYQSKSRVLRRLRVELSGLVDWPAMADETA